MRRNDRFFMARHGAILTFVLLLLAPRLRASEPAAGSSPHASQPLEYTVIVTGGELLLGEFPDGHTHFLTRTLRGLGLRCVGSMCVDDRREDILSALKFACQRVPLVIVTGGLGPTDNDITRETLSEFSGVPLREDGGVLADFETRFGTARGQLRQNLRRQARVPSRGTCFPNPGGTAVGLVFDQPQRVLVALPGPPSELQPMVREQLVPWLSRRFGTSAPGASLNVRFIGVGQSQVNAEIDAHLRLPPEAIMLSRFDAGRVDFTFAMPDDSPAARRRLEQLREQLQRHLGDHIYEFGDESLEAKILCGIRERGESLGVVEIGSGGAIVAALSRYEREDHTVRGGVVVGERAELERLLADATPAADRVAGGERAGRELADTAAKWLDSDWLLLSLLVQSDGGPRVQLLLRAPDGRTEQHWLPPGGQQSGDRDRLVTRVLERLWRALRTRPE